MKPNHKIVEQCNLFLEQFSFKQQNPMQKQELKSITIRFVLVCEPAVGNSSIIHHALAKTYKSESLTPTGSYFMFKNFTVDSIPVSLIVWNTASPLHFRGCDTVFFVYSLTNKKAFDNLERRIEYKRIYSDCEQLLVGNKSDVDQNAEVPREAVEELSLVLGIQWKEVSANMGDDGVQELIQEMVRKVLKRENVYLKDGEVKWENQMPIRPQTKSKCF